MRDFRSILHIIGLLLCIEATAMLLPMMYDLYYKNYDWVQFLYSSLVTFFIGIILFISFKKNNIIGKKIKKIGETILQKTTKEIDKFIYNENKKT